MKQIFYITLFLSICALHGAEKPKNATLSFLPHLPKDIVTVISCKISFSDDREIGVYPIKDWHDGSGDALILPSSLRFTTLIHPLYVLGVALKRTICTQAGHDAIPSMQCWVTTDSCSPYDIKIYNRLENRRHCHRLSWFCGPMVRFFDGINVLGLAVYAESKTDPQYGGSTVTTICFSEKGEDDNVHMKSPLGRISALLVHPERNTALFVFHDKNGQHIEISDRQPTGQHILHIASPPISKTITKMNCLGDDRYMGIYEDGTLLFFELHNTDEGRSCAIYNQKCAYKFKDAAVDLSCKTQSGLYPRIALMTEENKIFLCDLRYGQKPMLFHARTLKNSDKTVLYYDRNKLGVMHTKDDGTATHFELFPETYEGLYLIALLKPH